MANQRFQVLTHLTAEEYEEDARLCAANPGKRRPMLQEQSAINDMSFHEDLIVLLVRDALTQVTDDDEQLDRLDKIDLPHMDLEEWPVEMKAEIMQAGANHWFPEPGTRAGTGATTAGTRKRSSTPSRNCGSCLNETPGKPQRHGRSAWNRIGRHIHRTTPEPDTTANLHRRQRRNQEAERGGQNCWTN